MKKAFLNLFFLRILIRSIGLTKPLSGQLSQNITFAPRTLAALAAAANVRLGIIHVVSLSIPKLK